MQRRNAIARISDLWRFSDCRTRIGIIMTGVIYVSLLYGLPNGVYPYVLNKSVVTLVTIGNIVPSLDRKEVQCSSIDLSPRSDMKHSRTDVYMYFNKNHTTRGLLVDNREAAADSSQPNQIACKQQ